MATAARQRRVLLVQNEQATEMVARLETRRYCEDCSHHRVTYYPTRIHVLI